LSLEIRPVPGPGTEAPDFCLASTAGNDVTLSSFRGSQNVLLAFFPLAFTSTCTREVCAFSEDYTRFLETGTAVLPISVDATPSLKAYKQKYDLGVDLLSDFKREASAAYGVLLPDKYFSTRAYFLIDRQGIVQWVHVEDVLGHLRDNSELLDRIATLG